MRDLQMRDSRWQAPDEAWRSTIMSGDIASRFIAVSTSVSPFSTLDAATATFERVGAQALLGDLERRARARARLEEQVDDRLAAQRRHFLDRPLADLPHRFGGVEHAVDLVAREVGDAEQILLHSWISTSSRPSISVSRTCTLCVARRRQVLADVVGLDRQLAVAAVDQHDQLNRLAAGRSRSARRAPRASSGRCRARRPPAGCACRRSRTESRSGGRPAAAPTGVAHQVVAVERDVEGAGRHLVAGDLAGSAARGAARAARRACGCRRAPARRRPRLRSRISWAMRVSVRPMRSASMTTGMLPLCGLSGPR